LSLVWVNIFLLTFVPSFFFVSLRRALDISNEISKLYWA
jgi:hypothetical protein